MRLILLVEDDKDSRDNLAALLRSRGYEVVTAANGKEAFRWLARTAVLPMVILLDLVMPVMDGWHFRWQQLQDSHLAQIPVVILSAEQDAGKVATTLGAAGYLPKPVDPGGLLHALRHAHC